MEECKNYIHKYKCDWYMQNHNNCSNCEFKLPEEYLYDCETDKFIVYRNKYTGKEIHISKDENQHLLSNKYRDAFDKIIKELDFEAEYATVGDNEADDDQINRDKAMKDAYEVSLEIIHKHLDGIKSKYVSRGEWIKKPCQLCECPDGYEPKNCKEERQKEFCNCNWANIYHKFICKSCGYEPKGSDQDFLPNFCANCGADMRKNRNEQN